MKNSSLKANIFRILFVFVFVLTALTIISADNAWALSGSYGENVTYTLNTTTGVMIISGTGDMEDFSGFFYNPLYNYRNKIKTVQISDGVTSIGSSAFYEWENLTSVKIPSSVTRIGDKAFKGCKSLSSIKIPDHVTSFGMGAFQDCRSLTSISIPDGVNCISWSAFSGCSSLESIEIPENVTLIEQGAFLGCSSLTSIKLPAKLNFIANRAFAECSSLSSITIPNNVTSTGTNVFSGCSSMTSVNILAKLKSINEETFSRCSSMTSITIPDSVTSIGTNAFTECSSLEKIYYHGEKDKWNEINGISSLSDKTIVFNYHPEGNIISIEDATCESVGNMVYDCAYGCKNISKEIPAKGHLLEKAEAKPATNNEYYICSVCDKVFKDAEGKIEEKDIGLLVVDKKVYGKGSEILIPIEMKKNPGIISLILDLDYDKTALELVDLIPGDALSGGQWSRRENGDVSQEQICWEYNLSKVDESGIGTLVTLKFQLKEGAEYEKVYQISATCNYDNSGASDTQKNPVRFVSKSGELFINDFVYGNVSGDEDGEVDTMDVAYLKWSLEGLIWQTENMLRTADVNCDGNINMLDIMILERHVAKWKNYEILPHC